VIRDAIARLNGATVLLWNHNGEMLFASIAFPGMEWKPDLPIAHATRAVPPPERKGGAGGGSLPDPKRAKLSPENQNSAPRPDLPPQEARDLVQRRALYLWCGLLTDNQRVQMEQSGLPITQLTAAQRDTLARLIAQTTGTTRVPNDGILRVSATNTPFSGIVPQVTVSQPLGATVVTVQ
jgi:hypothetical protein